MAVNTAFVASSELIERVAHRYGFHWIVATNRKNSLYRIHVMDAILFSVIVLITSGSQAVLADMYAIGLVASFCINMGSLLIYRYFMGTKEVIPYSTSRLGTLVLFVVLTSCFVFLAWDKPHGTALWGTLTCVVLTAGIIVAKKRRPERAEVEQAESEMDVILYLADAASPDLNVFFSRPREDSAVPDRRNDVYVSFFSPRQGIPRSRRRQPFQTALRESRDLPSHGCIPQGDRVRTFRAGDHGSFRMAHVVLVGPHVYRRDGVQSDETAHAFPQAQFRYRLQAGFGDWKES